METTNTLSVAGVALITAATAFAQTPFTSQVSDAKTKKLPFYTQTNLVSSMKGLKGKIHDKNL